MSADGKWFVMMYSQSGEHVVPLVDENDIPMLFDTKKAAYNAAKDNGFAQAFGFQAYEVGG